VNPADVASNMVYFRTPDRPAATVARALEKAGLRCGAPTAPDQIRLVTHLDISRDDTKEICRIIRSLAV